MKIDLRLRLIPLALPELNCPFVKRNRFARHLRREKILFDSRVLQRECFEKNKLSMEEYQQAMLQYEDKLSKAIEERIKVESKLLHLFKIKGKKKAFGEEKKRLIEMVKKVQDDYLNKGKMETRIYENTMKTYSGRLAEIEEELAFFEAKEQLTGNSKLSKLFNFWRNKAND